jgi:hypothetical protein
VIWTPLSATSTSAHIVEVLSLARLDCGVEQKADEVTSLNGSKSLGFGLALATLTKIMPREWMK